MVQKDDDVTITFCTFHCKCLKSENSRRLENSQRDTNTIIESIRTGFKCIDSNQNLTVENITVSFLDEDEGLPEADVTESISCPEKLQRELAPFLRNMKGTSVKVSIEYVTGAAPCSEDELQLGTSASPTFPEVSEFSNQPVVWNTTHDYEDIDDKKKLSKKPSNDKNYLEQRIYSNEENAGHRYVGLVNQAMTCYLNSLLQALYMTPEFRNALYYWEYKTSSDRDAKAKSIPFQLQKLFLNLQTSSKNAVETTSLTRSFGWDSSEAWHQHDIQELCRVMFDALEQNFKNTAQADLINRLYEGKINDYVKCLTCNTEKFREDTFLDIPLPVRPFDTNTAYGSVEEALEAFVKYETLEGNNQYFCEKCNKKSNAHKGLKFTKFPYILTLQLKRFDFDQTTYHRIKLNDKVTFPDVLNLNSFIESTSNQESPSREEDAGMSIKCDDSTTDSSTMDEECTPCDVSMSNSNHLTNHDQDDDEGIDMSNGMSSSSCSTHGHNNEKLREEYASAKGPYIYELFSIMIHSGSASGGHYYVYIKDFRTNKWLCFNDQSVSPITEEDIQKSYGGGSKNASYYNGAFRSSTNAYMLMYRQIDRDRNTLPMSSEKFPAHIQDLLEKMEKNEEDRSYQDESESMERPLQKFIHFRHPTRHTIEEVPVSINLSQTFGEVAEAAYKNANIEDFVDLNQCRIASYFPDYDLIDQVYEQKHTRLDDVFNKPHTIKDLILDIKEKSSKDFEKYPFEPIITKVYVVDAIEKDLVDGPKYVRAHVKQTIKEYKQELVKHFDLDPNKVILYSKELGSSKLMDDDHQLEEIMGLPKYVYVIFATENYEPETLKNFYGSTFRTISDCLSNNIVTFYLNTSDISEEEKKNIPSCKEYYSNNFLEENTTNKGQENNSIDLDSICAEMLNMKTIQEDAQIPALDINEPLKIDRRGDQEINNVQISALDMNKPFKIDRCSALGNRETFKMGHWDVQETNNIPIPALDNRETFKIGHWDVQETTNTPIPAPDANEHFKSDQSAGQETSNIQIPAPDINEHFKADQWAGQETSNSEDSSLSDSDRTLIGDPPDESEIDCELALNRLVNNKKTNPITFQGFFKLTQPKNSKFWKISMDITFTEEELKERLERYLDIPKNYFKIARYHPAGHYRQSSLKFKEDRKYTLRLERVLLPNEYELDIQSLQMEDPEPLQRLFTAILRKRSSLEEVKREIKSQIKQNKNLDVDVDSPLIVFLFMEDGHVVHRLEAGDLNKLPSCFNGICIQKLPVDYLVNTRETSDFNAESLIVYVKRWSRTNMSLQETRHIILKPSRGSEFMKNFVEQLSISTNLPHHTLLSSQFTTMKATNHYMQEEVDNLLWEDKLDENDIDSYKFILYRDPNETPKILSSDEKVMQNIGERRCRFNRSRRRDQMIHQVSTPMSSMSPRKEKALKIHVDST